MRSALVVLPRKRSAAAFPFASATHHQPGATPAPIRAPIMNGTPRAASTTKGTINRIVWLFYEPSGRKEERNFSLSWSEQTRLALAGWRVLNPEWDVRLLDAS